MNSLGRDRRARKYSGQFAMMVHMVSLEAVAIRTAAVPQGAFRAYPSALARLRSGSALQSET
jgi:hypothetical protein